MGIVLLGGLAVGYWAAFAPNTQTFSQSRTVKIPPESSFEAVVDSLESSDVIRSSISFKLFATASGWYQQVKPGLYRFSSGVSNVDILGRLRRGQQDALRVTIPPGIRPGVLAAIVSNHLQTDSTAMRQALRDSALAAELDTDTLHLFGYMLPETYQFYWLSSSDQVVRRIKKTLDDAFTPEMIAQSDSLGLSKDEVIRLASIVEWEAHRADEKRTIAGVYINRLEDGMPLQADPTVQYAVMQNNDGKKRRLLFEDYEISHPYNTYQYVGLPPGPVTNPSLSTIKAVLEAEDHEYRFFVADGSGGHVFSRTFSEHRRAAAEYRRLMRERRRD